MSLECKHGTDKWCPLCEREKNDSSIEGRMSQLEERCKALEARIEELSKAKSKPRKKKNAEQGSV